jgi:hypothetical protein
MASEFEFHAVSVEEVKARLQARSTRTRQSKGRKLVEQFLASSEVAATIAFDTAKERDGFATSARRFVQVQGASVWVRKESDLVLLLVNLDLADKEIIDQYEAQAEGRRRS